MDEKIITLEDAIALMVSQAAAHGVRLTRLKLVKLLYFLDLQAWEENSRSVTGVQWMWHHYGPYSPAIGETCKAMQESGEVFVQEGANYYGNPEYRIISVREMYYRTPSENVVRLVRSTLLRYGGQSPSRLKDLSYQTAPMQHVLHHGQRGDALEFVAPPPRTADVRRTIDRYARLARATQGETIGPVARGLHEDAEFLEPARLSATERMLADDEGW